MPRVKQYTPHSLFLLCSAVVFAALAPKVARGQYEFSGDGYAYDVHLSPSDSEFVWYDHAPDDCGPLGLGLFKRRLLRWPRWLPQIHYGHGDPHHPMRYTGRGEPLVGASWLNRPFHVDPFFGGWFGDDLIRGRVDQGNSALGGVRLGWDMDHYWGFEARVAVTESPLLGLNRNGRSDIRIWDVSTLYYPWGDATWRPFVSVGAGLVNFEFIDDRNRLVDEMLFQLPVGVGLKRYVHNWLALRLDVTDNIAFGASGLNTMHNYSFTGVVEFHFGGRRPIYFPFDADEKVW